MTVPFEQRLVFSHVVEGLYFRALKDQMTDRIRTRLRDEVGLDLTKKLEPALPFAKWTQCLVITAQEISPDKTVEEGLEYIGLILTRGYFDTLVGKALAGLLRVIGPMRGLKRMDRSLRSGNNFGEVKVTEKGPAHVEFWCNELGIARHHMLGLIKAGAEVCGAKNLRGSITRFDDQGVTFDIQWDP
ncbi:MAG: DUF2378 family protein [Archangium sp.]